MALLSMANCDLGLIARFWDRNACPAEKISSTFQFVDAVGILFELIADLGTGEQTAYPLFDLFGEFFAILAEALIGVQEQIGADLQ